MNFLPRVTIRPQAFKPTKLGSLSATVSFINLSLDGPGDTIGQVHLLGAGNRRSAKEGVGWDGMGS